MDHWRATVAVWPHSSGKGADVDQAFCGDRLQYLDFLAEDIDDALRVVKGFVRGIETNPAVWQAPIIGLARKMT